MSDDESKNESTDDSERQSDEQPTDSDQPVEQSEEQPADSDQPVEQAEEQPAESEQPVEQSEEQPGASEQPTEQSDDKPADQSGELSAGRQNMLDLINKWMPTSLNSPMIPDGETQDLLARAGWT